MHHIHTQENHPHPGSSARRFARHYAEMILAMFAGMVVLGIPAIGALGLAGVGYDELTASAPALAILGMGVAMTVPMVAWMRYRGHGWQPSAEMAGAMLAPTFAAIGLIGAGVLDYGGAMAIEHVAMFPAMLAVMLVRYDEYATPHAAHARLAEATA